MIVKIRAITYIISWMHDIIDVEDYAEAHAHEYEVGEEIEIPNSSCTCEIFILEKGGIKEQISLGIARCSHRDQYSRNKGRKISLARALEAANVLGDRFDKEDRQKIWYKYAEHVRNWKAA